MKSWKLSQASITAHDHPEENLSGVDLCPAYQRRHNGGPMFKSLPQAFELQRLRRLKEVVVRSATEFGESRMTPAEDWMMDLESRIATRERGLGIDSRLAR
jgi:hypothetical protein